MFMKMDKKKGEKIIVIDTDNKIGQYMITKDIRIINDNRAGMKSQEISYSLQEAELSLRTCLRSLQSLDSKKCFRRQQGHTNSGRIIATLMRVLSHSFTSLELLLRFLSDMDIVNVGSCCLTLRQLIYSPLGYRLIRCLRPPVLVVEKESELPTFTPNALENLCSDRSLANLDEDDQEAIVQTMKTNLFATKQKITQIHSCNLEYDSRIKVLFEQIYYLSAQRDQLLKDIEQAREHLEKLHQMKELSRNHVDELVTQQKTLVQHRRDRIQAANAQKLKLEKQKELLIKKIKHQQKQREEGLVYAREVERILALLNKITNKK